MATGPKNGWGGRRPNQTGRPRKYTDSENLRRALLRKAKQWEKKFGQGVDDILLTMIHGRNLEGIPVDVQDKTRATAIKIFKEYTQPRESIQSVTVKDERPRILLPEMRQDPSMAIPEKVGEA
jgi:hypothetical protein